MKELALEEDQLDLSGCRTGRVATGSTPARDCVAICR
jgi:hypothetical protein